MSEKKTTLFFDKDWKPVPPEEGYYAKTLVTDEEGLVKKSITYIKAEKEKQEQEEQRFKPFKRLIAAKSTPKKK